MKKRHAWVLALLLGATSSIGTAVVASAESSTLLPTLEAEIVGSISPKTLPRQEMTPISLGIQGAIKTTDGSHPSALREATVDLGREVSIDAEGLAVCRVSALRDRDVAAARRICRKSIVGSGSARFGIGSTQSPPPASDEAQSTVSSQLTLYNGGVVNGTTTLLVHGSISSPSPVSLVMVVKINRKGKGLHAVAKLPRIAEGQGSLLGFRFTLGRYFWREGEKQSYLNAKCPDGQLTVSFPALAFRNDAREAQVPAQSLLEGSVNIPCAPQAD